MSESRVRALVFECTCNGIIDKEKAVAIFKEHCNHKGGIGALDVNAFGEILRKIPHTQFALSDAEVNAYEGGWSRDEATQKRDNIIECIEHPLLWQHFESEKVPKDSGCKCRLVRAVT